MCYFIVISTSWKNNIIIYLNNLRGKMQSAYPQAHGIETALLRVYNDMLLAVDKGKEIVLILLDYSAAFDTINRDVFLTRLAERYGIIGSVLRWFSTYFHNRSQYVPVNGTLSKPHTHHWRVYLKDQSLGHCPLPCTQHHWRILFMHMALAE